MAEEYREREWWEWEVPPYGAILVAVVGAVVVLPMVLGDPSAVTESIQEIVSPAGMLFVPLALLLLIRFLSSERSNFLSELLTAPGEPYSIHRAGGSPFGVALLLLLLLFLVYYRSSLLGNGDGDGDDENGD